MSLTNKISVIIDVTTEKGVKALGNFRTAVKDAEGFTGKLKAGVGSLGQTFGAAAKNPAVMASAVTAVGAAALAAANEFSQTAKAALDLSTATGLSTEEASRWIAVGDDFEVTAEALATGLGKVTKTMNDTKWADYGIATRDAGGAARATNDILLDAFDVLSRITNKTEQARVGQELFGKGYQSLTPILGKTRAEYEKMLGAVEDGQVITDAEAEKAEKYRLAMDDLGDALHDMSLVAGEEVVPALTAAAEAVVYLLTAIRALKDNDPIAEFTDGITGVFTSLPETVGNFGEFLAKQYHKATTSSEDLAKETENLTKTSDEYRGSAQEVADATERAADAAREAREAHARLTGELRAQREAVDALAQAERDLYGEQMSRLDAERALERQTDDTQESIADYNETVEEYGAASEEASDASRNAADDMIDLAAAQAEAAFGTTTSKEAIDAQIISLAVMQSTLVPGSPLWLAIDAHIKHLEAIPTEVATKMSVTGDRLTLKGKRAKGGPVSTGGAYLVGEEGPEVVSLPGGSYVTPNDQINGSMSPLVGRGGSPITVNIYPRTMPTDTELIDLVTKVRRRGGNI